MHPDLVIEEVPRPTPGPGDALVRVRLAGVCNTDLEIVRGYMDFRGTLGHEFVGEVVECQDPSWLGQRVTSEINLGCGACERCNTGLARHCAKRSVLGILGKDGCFAEYVVVPVGNLLVVPEAIDDDCAVFIEPLAAAFEILEQVEITERDRVLVLGDGKLGLLISMVLAQTGCELHAAGHHPEKLQFAKRVGAHTWAANSVPDGEFDVTVEATGVAAGLQLAIERTRPRGTVVLKSTFHGATPVEAAGIVIDELTIIGSRCGLFPPAIEALERGLVDPRPLIDSRYDLEDAVHAFERAREHGILKVLLRPR
ncbi:MAG: alcohol dehydrogenase catalytic domain-containing protein [bacterium]|nr:alcohol dehydrogenase catalytic domain-containing protein [bacterium]